jgi:DNA-binding transcriptional LysR family regulator
VNNGDAMLPALLAGAGVGILPDFLARAPIEAGSLERLLPDWSIQIGSVYWVTAMEGPMPRRVEVLRDYLVSKLAEDPVDQSRPPLARNVKG